MINELIILILVCNIPQKKVGGLVWTSEISQPTTTVTSVWVTLRRTRNQTNRRSWCPAVTVGDQVSVPQHVR